MIFVHVQDEVLLARGSFQRCDRHRDLFVTDPEEPTHGNYSIRNFAFLQVEHEVAYRPDFFVLKVLHRHLHESARLVHVRDILLQITF